MLNKKLINKNQKQFQLDFQKLMRCFKNKNKVNNKKKTVKNNENNRNNNKKMIS